MVAVFVGSKGDGSPRLEDIHVYIKPAKRAQRLYYVYFSMKKRRTIMR